MPDERFKLPRSSYEELCKIIKAYGRITRLASLDEVNALAGVGSTVVSANNSFLASVGVIEGGKAKTATPKGKDLAKALEHNITDEIQHQWSRVVQENEFLSKMLTAIQIRRSMELDAFEAHIAYSAGEAKSNQVMTGARTVIDILRAAGAVAEKEGRLTPGLLTETVPIAAPVEADDQNVPGPIPLKTTLHEHESVRAGLIIRIDLRIEAKPSDLEGLGGRLRRLLDEIQAKADDTDGNKS